MITSTLFDKLRKSIPFVHKQLVIDLDSYLSHPKINYDWDVPVDIVPESHLSIVPQSLDDVLSSFEGKPFGMTELLSITDQKKFSDYMNDASRVVRDFAIYATSLATHKSELYQDLQAYVLHGPGLSSTPQEKVEMTFIRAAEMLHAKELFENNPEEMIAYLQEKHAELPAVKFYTEIKQREKREIRDVQAYGQVIASYLLHKEKSASTDDFLLKTG